jgi:hypothetical protein
MNRRQDGMFPLNQAKKKGQVPPSYAFYSIQTLNRLDDVHPIGQGNMLY